jgi:eukaryotic-like serine/threonine-protein kinase
VSSTAPQPKGKRPDPLLGSVVNGKYRILALVAAGGMGKIYQAEQLPLGRSVALKVLHTTADTDGHELPFKKRFLREASILARLQHPNIVTVFDYGAIEGEETERYFISMEYLSGESLSQRITERVSLATRDTIRIARQIARGLTEAHAHGVIHRDLKPSNVMLLAGRDGEEMVKIVDFGIVKIIGDAAQEKEDLTQEGSFIGSPKYMAPEQISRGGKVDARTDVYSFGIILYQCLTGTVPFDGASSIQTLMAHLNQPPDPIHERAPNADVPEWLDQLVMSCIAKDPAKRPQTMDVVAKTLAEAEAALTSSQIMAAMAMRASSPTLTASLDSPPRSVRGALDTPPATTPVGPRIASGVTTQGTIASVHPSSDESDRTRTSPGVVKKAPEKKRSPVLPLVLALGVASVVLGTVALLDGPHRDPAPAAALSQAPPIPPTMSHFTIRIESTPPGADVREGDRVLGTTPMELSIDTEAARSAPRSFTLVKDGFLPYPIIQGPSDETVRVIAPLAPLPIAAAAAATSTSVSARAGAPSATSHRAAAGHSAPTTAPTPTASNPDLEIRMSR